MKIFITGGCGFIGSNFIIKQIDDEKNNILNYDKLTYAGNLDNLSSINNNKRYEFINGDITDFSTLKSAIFEYAEECLLENDPSTQQLLFQLKRFDDLISIQASTNRH